MDAAPRTRILLIRHGEARSGVDGIVGGPKGCTGLTDVGRAQAERLRDRFARADALRPDILVASILPRAIETAKIVAGAFEPGLTVRTDCDYCEMHPGECDGMPWGEARARYMTAPDGPDVPMSPGGESTRQFDARVRRALFALISANGGSTIVMFTHGGFVIGATLALLGAPGMHASGERPFRLYPRNTSITEFGRTAASDQWMFERYNDTAHLEP
ncbi:MAG: histidine phosphatase family protein [Acidimicrobiia bacterium]